jgi:hypothetical protein
MACSAPTGVAMLGCCGGTQPPTNTAINGNCRAVGFRAVNQTQFNVPYQVYTAILAYEGHPEYDITGTIALPGVVFDRNAPDPTYSVVGNTGAVGWDWLTSGGTQSVILSGPDRVYTPATGPAYMSSFKVVNKFDVENGITPIRARTTTTMVSGPLVGVPKADIYADFLRRPWGSPLIRYDSSGAFREVDTTFLGGSVDSAFWVWGTDRFLPGGVGTGGASLDWFFGYLPPPLGWNRPKGGDKVAYETAFSNHHAGGDPVEVAAWSATFSKAFSYYTGTTFCQARWGTSQITSGIPDACFPNQRVNQLIEIIPGGDFTTPSTSLIYPPTDPFSGPRTKPTCCNIAP